MENLASYLVLLVGLQHVSFFVIEFFLWDTPTGHKLLELKPEVANQSHFLAKNQAFYNLFLAAGLFWSLCEVDLVMRIKLQVFFLVCVVVAGIVGALTANKKIFFLQSLPALLALGALSF